MVDVTTKRELRAKHSKRKDGAPAKQVSPRSVVPGVDREITAALCDARNTVAQLWQRLPEGGPRDRARAAAEILNCTAAAYGAAGHDATEALYRLEHDAARSLERLGAPPLVFRAPRKDPFLSRPEWLELMERTLRLAFTAFPAPLAPFDGQAPNAAEAFADWFLGFGSSPRMVWFREQVPNAEEVFSGEPRHTLPFEHPALKARAALIQVFDDHCSVHGKRKTPDVGKLIGAAFGALGVHNAHNLWSFKRRRPWRARA
jgi:hypothetical protein